MLPDVAGYFVCCCVMLQTLYLLLRDVAGHCAKMMGILQRALLHHGDKLWHVVVDDDTLLRWVCVRWRITDTNPQSCFLLSLDRKSARFVASLHAAASCEA